MTKTSRSPLVLMMFVAVAAIAAPPPSTKAVAGPVSAQQAYDSAREAALRWRPDARMFDLGTTSEGPLDGEGRSAEWSIKWSSQAGGDVNLMLVKNGKVEAFAHPGAGGRVIELQPDSIMDSKKLLEMADAAAGAAARAAGNRVSLGLVQNPRTGVGPLWHVSYAPVEADGRRGTEAVHVAIEAKGGKLQVLKP